VAAPSSISGVSITSPCGTVTPNFVLTNPGSNLSNALNGTEVSQLCAAALPNSSCSGGNKPGVMQLIFEAIVVLPPCNFWTIGFSPQCCRTTNVNLSSASSGAFVQATLNNSNNTCNTSPSFTEQPLAYVCAGQMVTLNFCVFEPDGDSLVYSFISGWSAPNNSNVFNFPYTGAAPLLSATINSKTGEVVFTPYATGNYVVVVEVREYDANGNLIGTTMRDMVVFVNICNNQSPYPKAQVLNYSGSGALLDSSKFEVCVGESISFDVMFCDPDTSDSLSIETNLNTILPGATYSTFYPSNSRDTIIVSVNWQVPPIPKSKLNFGIKVVDNACDYIGIFCKKFTIKIKNATEAFTDQTICKSTQLANLKVVGGRNFTWKAIPGGDSLVVGLPGIGNFSCDTCQFTQAYPSKSTCYEVTSSFSNSCKNRDTVCVRVVSDFSYTKTSDTLICYADSFELKVVPADTNQTYTFNWRAGVNTLLGNLSSIKVKPNYNTKYGVSLASDSGCVKYDSINISVSTPFSRNNQVLLSDSIICFYDTIKLAVDLVDFPTNTCGPNQFGCIGIPNDYIVGSGVLLNSNLNSFNNNQGWPSPFPGQQKCSKQQYLYHATDLIASGMPAGQINSIGFNVIANNGPSIFNHYSIKIGCTNESDLSNNWETGLTDVYGPKSTPATIGWNNLNFDLPYNWDGISNLVIEINFDNLISSENAIIQYQSTNYFASSYYGSSLNSCAPSTQSFLSPIQKLPNIKFQVCSGINPNNYNFNWLNTSNLISPSVPTDTSIEMFVNLASPKKHQLAISDTAGVCFDTIDFNIHVTNKYNVKPQNTSPICENSQPINLQSFTPYNLTDSGGIWTGNGIINDTLGTFDPSISGFGSFWIKYGVFGDLCAAEDSSLITVNPLPKNLIFNSDVICRIDSVLIIQGINAGIISSNNIFIQNAITDSFGVIDLSVIPSFVDPLQINRYIPLGCKNDTNIQFIIKDPMKLEILPAPKFCGNDSIFQIFQKDSLNTGAWNGVGVINKSLGLIDPNLLPKGDSSAIYLDSNGFCFLGDTTFLFIDTIPKISVGFNLGFEGPYCKNDSSIISFFGVPQNIPLTSGTGSWIHLNNWLSGSGNNFSFSPSDSNLSIGLYKSVYNFENLNGCKNSDTIKFEILNDDLQPFIILDSSNLLFVNSSNNSIKWFWNNTFDTTLGTDNFAEPLLSGLYKVFLSNKCDSAFSNEIFFGALAVEQIKRGKQIEISPNPSNGEFRAFFPSSFLGKNISIHNSIGQIINQFEVSNSNMGISISTKGIYFLRVENENEIIKLIVK